MELESKSGCDVGLDGKGTFTDIENGVDGVGTLVEGNNIFEGYDGNSATFSNQWMHWSDDGLLIGQFGHSAPLVQPNGSAMQQAVYHEAIPHTSL